MAFPTALLGFLDDLAENNQRSWFQANKARYESLVRDASFAFIRELAPRFATLSPHFRVDEKALFRIHRDTRFSHDKRPYKTHVGLHFRHMLAGGDVHTPGFYLHIEPARPGSGGHEGMADGGCWFGAGLWMPDGPTLRRLRADIDVNGDKWADAFAKARAHGLTPSTEALARVPAGFAKDHPHADLLRLKSHTVAAPIGLDTVFGPGLTDAYLRHCEAAAPMLRALCAALELPF